MKLWRRGLAGLLLVLLMGVLSGHVRLRNPATGNPLEWASPTVPMVIQLDGSDDVGDLSDTSAIRLALQDWSNMEGSSLRFIENTDLRERARRDWRSNDLHTLLFDEDGSTGFFQAGGIVAVTAISYQKSGRIVDADVLFNGRDYAFGTGDEYGAFDVQAIAAHELGHVAGFDHSAWVGATLYPYVEPNGRLERGLSSDELGAVRSVYPAGSFGVIAGSVAHAKDGTPVAGAQVVAVDLEGRPVFSILAGGQGDFRLEGLESGRYNLRVLPFRGVISSINLSPGRTIDSGFASLPSVGPIDVLSGEVAGTDVLLVDQGTGLSIGTQRDLLPLRLVPGKAAGVTLGGVGLVDGCVLSSSDPDLQIQNVTWSGGSVSFRVAVPVGEPFGPVDLLVTSPQGETSVLTSGLEITPTDPTVLSAVPAALSADGGTSVRITGTGFREGCRLLIGDQIYREGLPGGCTLLDQGTLSLTLRSTLQGRHDVVVIDRSGVEGRLAAGVLVDARPTIRTLFPRAGQRTGGTLVRLTGTGFEAGTRVLLDGREQDNLQILDDGRLQFLTTDSAIGIHSLEVQNSSPAAAVTSFAMTEVSDPELLSINPGVGLRTGGERIELLGINLDPACRVVFGVDPDTGLGGTEAQIVAAGDGTSLAVVTPVFAQSGSISVAIEDPKTGQAIVLPGAFYVREEGGSSGSACASIGAPPSDLRSIFESSAWMLCLFLLVQIRSRATNPGGTTLRGQ